MDVVGEKEIGERLGVQPNTVHQWMKRGVLSPPAWSVSGMPAWDWESVMEALRLPDVAPELRLPILAVLEKSGDWTVSSVTLELARHGVVDARSQRQVWSALNDLLEEGLVELRLYQRWRLPQPTNQPVIGGAGQPAPLASGPNVPRKAGR